MIKILIADDHRIIRDGLRGMLECIDDFEVAGESADSASTLQLIRSTSAHVVLLDLSMPGQAGIRLVRDVRKLDSGLRILVLTMHHEQRYASQAFRAGANGYMMKSMAVTDLVAAIRKVISGGIYMTEEAAGYVAGSLAMESNVEPGERLSEREFAVFHGIYAGLSLMEIADHLGLSVKTVSTYRTRLLDKLALPNNAALIHYAMRHALFGDLDVED